MAKSIIKQISIMLLICVAIGLLLAVIFYKYIPSNKIVPSKVTPYETQENIASEISENLVEEQFESENKVYEVTDSDLSLYKKTQSYNPGKADPFEAYSENSTSTEDGNANNETTTGKNNPVSNINTTDNYYTSANISSGTK